MVPELQTMFTKIIGKVVSLLTIFQFSNLNPSVSIQIINLQNLELEEKFFTEETGKQLVNGCQI